MSEHLNEQQISSEVWLAVLLPLLEDGYTLKLSPSGNSMYPFMVGGRDFVILRHTGKQPVERGAIVLYRRDNGMMILHRIYRRSVNSYLLLGDNQTEIEYDIRPDQICAVAAEIVRNGKRISCDGFWYRCASELWLIFRPLRPFLLKLKRIVWRR